MLQQEMLALEAQGVGMWDEQKAIFTPFGFGFENDKDNANDKGESGSESESESESGSEGEKDVNYELVFDVDATDPETETAHLPFLNFGDPLLVDVSLGNASFSNAATNTVSPFLSPFLVSAPSPSLSHSLSHSLSPFLLGEDDDMEC